MKIKAYFLFPEDDNYFLAIGNDIHAYHSIISEVAIIIKELKKNEFDIFYDSENLKIFFEKIAVLNTEPYLGKLHLQLKSIIDKKSQDIRTKPKSNPACYYAIWNYQFAATQAPMVISELSEANINKQPNECFILINIENAIENPRDNIYSIKDALHLSNLPLFIPIQVANNHIEFVEWHASNINQKFSIRNKAIFLPTSYRWIKQRIYQRISDGSYWYFDYYHKDNKMHFEIFDNTGKNHIGEADMEGVIDTSKADKEKKIDDRIK